MIALRTPRGSCRLCASTIEQRRVGRERRIAAGQWLMRCGVCGGLWLDPDMSPTAQAQFYADHYRKLFPAEAARQYDAAFIAALRLNEIADRRIDRLMGGLPSGGRVLEIGSGFGAFLGRLSARRPDVTLFACEPDAAHRAVALAGAQPNFLDDPATAAPFDLIVAFHVLEHLPEPGAALSDWRDWLAPKGWLAVEVPDCGALWSGWREVHPAHVSYFSAGALDRLIARVGGLGPSASEGAADLKNTPLFAGVLWRVLGAGSMPQAERASAAEIAALDARLDAAPWGWRDRLRQGALGIAIRLIGMERVGAWRRWAGAGALNRLLVRPGQIDCLGLPLDPITEAEVQMQAAVALAGGGRLALADLNVAKLTMAREDPALAAALRAADLVLADGMGILFGLRMLGIHLPARIAGIDLAGALIGLCAARGWRPYLLGATPEVVAAAAARWQTQYPGLQFAGWRDGYFRADEDAAVAAAIRASGADLLIVAMGVPRQEIFLAEYGAASGARVTMAVGGALDVVAGRLKRAPLWMQRVGLEWAFRLAQEPLRLGRRYLISNSRFALLLLWARLMERRR